MNTVFYEGLICWPVYQTLHDHLRRGDARTADPRDLVGCVAAYGIDRAACLIYAHQGADTLAEAHRLVEHILADAANGVRPR
ncbi:MAG: hypothetical protein LC798_21810, partial [Chloroflexi bacterium]|nr:hypothetical protein [Chloroflexota bacterium]